MPDRTGVLLTAFGGPDSLEAVGPFMTRLMGREPSPEIVERAQAKYRAIGGSSPLTQIGRKIETRLAEELSARGHDIPVRLGMRYWAPYIAESMGELATLDVRRVVMISLSAFESKVACGAYREAATEALSDIEVVGICEAPALNAAPQFREFLGRSCAEALAASGGESPMVVMTAHSLPLADVEQDDPYVAGLESVASHVAETAGLGSLARMTDDSRLPGVETFGSLEGSVPWAFAYQSKGLRPGGWLEPDLDDVMASAADAGHDSIVVLPIGFATDHMETLYDLDIVAAERAEELGLRFTRAKVANDDSLLIEGLADLVEPLL